MVDDPAPDHHRLLHQYIQGQSTWFRQLLNTIVDFIPFGAVINKQEFTFTHFCFQKQILHSSDVYTQGFTATRTAS